MRVLLQLPTGFRHIGSADITDGAESAFKVQTGPGPEDFALFFVAWMPEEHFGPAQRQSGRAVLVLPGQDPSVLPGWRPLEDQ